MTILVLAGACGRRDKVVPEDEIQRENELNLFREGVKTVQERYVDADRVQLDSIISNSIKGMVASVDPYATILFTGSPAESSVPADVTLVEMKETKDPGIVVLNIFGFQPQTRKHLRSMESAARDREPAGVLIDARGAAGSDYTAALDLASWLLPRGSVLGSMVEKQGSETRPLTTRRAPIWMTNTVMVLIDRETSGPAEWLAAALQFYHRATLVGEPTRGVTVVQSPVPITDQWTVMLTTARVLNPDGIDITGKPLKPDIAAAPAPEEKENVDWLYLRGIDELQKKITAGVAAP